MGGTGEEGFDGAGAAALISHYGAKLAVKVGELDNSGFAEAWEVSVEVWMRDLGGDRDAAEKQLTKGLLQNV